MKPSTISQLNHLNQEFYQLTANEFDATRQQPWEGWQYLVPLLSKLPSEPSLLDLGCGNGRWAEFCQQHLDDFRYVGLDSNPKLLKKAEAKFASNTKIAFQRADLVADPISTPIGDTTFDLITAFGVVHHIPSLQLRQELFNQLATHLLPHGQAIVTLWQFTQSKNLLQRQVNPPQLGLDPSDLEANDYILDWQRGTRAYRYCHLVTENELQQLLENSGLHVTHEFQADGQTQTMNHYAVLEKAT